MKLKKDFYNNLIMLIMHADNKGTFSKEGTIEEWRDKVKSYISCFFLLCKEEIIKNQDFILSEEDKDVLKDVHALTDEMHELATNYKKYMENQ